MKKTLLDEILRDVDDDAERDSLRETWDRMGALEIRGPAPGFEQRFSQNLERPRKTAPRPSAPTKRLLPLAAVLVVGVALGGLGFWLATRSKTDGQTAPGAVAALLEPLSLAPSRLEAIVTLAEGPNDPAIRQFLTDLIRDDPSIDVRLCAIDAIAPHADDVAVAPHLIEAARRSESTLVKIRLIEVLVDRGVESAAPTIESMSADPRNDALVREAARWASGRLSKRTGT
jgi:hypothetical protein